MITPASYTLQAGEILQYSASVAPGSGNQTITWSVSGTFFSSEGCTGAGCGTIDASGRYRAPATAPYPPNVVITATPIADPGRAETAKLLIVNPSPQPCYPSNLFLLCTNVASVNFGAQTVNTTSAVRTVTLTNMSSAALQIYGGSGGTPGIWEDYPTTSDCPQVPQVLAAGASCTYSITFVPSTTGSRNGASLDIETGDAVGDMGVDVVLLGVGKAGG